MIQAPYNFFALSLNSSRCSSVVEHFLGKEEVGGSIPPIGSGH